ncbi:MAG: cell division ATP-binding protein FtsE [Coriobacteriaceae bacterium]|nr:cell division ATP-binding protein FtsE [Coriobacteriaceae bacterium]
MANHFRIVESEGLTDGAEQLEAITEDVAAEPLPDLETPAEAPGLIELPTIEQPASPSFTVPSVTDEPAVAPEPEPELPPMVDPLYAPLAAEEEQPIDRSGNPTISFRNVSLIYPSRPDKKALDDVSLDIYPGEFVFVVGHSGSGKSSLLRLITRELKATSGQVIVAGQDLTKLRNGKVPYLRRQIGCVFQDFKLLPDKTVYENVAFALECIGKRRAVIRGQVPEVLRLVGLADAMDKFPDQLSGGEQQRVSVARAMVNRPPLLVCDEPTGNLDPAISLGIMKLLDRINRTGTTVVMATHDREMVDSMRKRVIALEAGHVVRDQERGGYGFYGAL